MINNIVFLDIDGVLNSECYFLKLYRNMKDLKMIDTSKLTDEDLIISLSEIDPDSLKLLFSIIESTNSKIVIISPLRVRPYYNKVKGHLISLGLPIIGEIKCDTRLRGKGIKEFLNNNEVDNYIILDDEVFEDYDNELLPHLIKINAKDGLLEEDVKKAISMLHSKKLIKFF